MQLVHFDINGTLGADLGYPNENNKYLAIGKNEQIEIQALIDNEDEDRADWRLVAYSSDNKGIPEWSHSYRTKERLLEKFVEYTRIELPMENQEKGEKKETLEKGSLEKTIPNQHEEEKVGQIVAQEPSEQEEESPPSVEI